MTRKLFLTLLIALISSSCHKQATKSNELPNSSNSNVVSQQVEPKTKPLPLPSRETVQQKGINKNGELDLSIINHIGPSRIQDLVINAEYQDFVEKIGKTKNKSIPYLISNLENKIVLPEGAIDWWPQVTIADMSLTILIDLFDKRIPGTSWEVIGWNENSQEPVFNLLYTFVEKHGRRPIKKHWERIWKKYQNRIYWDGKEQVFKLK